MKLATFAALGVLAAGSAWGQAGTPNGVPPIYGGNGNVTGRSLVLGEQFHDPDGAGITAGAGGITSCVGPTAAKLPSDDAKYPFTGGPTGPMTFTEQRKTTMAKEWTWTVGPPGTMTLDGTDIRIVYRPETRDFQLCDGPIIIEQPTTVLSYRKILGQDIADRRREIGLLPK